VKTLSRRRLVKRGSLCSDIFIEAEAEEQNYLAIQDVIAGETDEEAVSLLNTIVDEAAAGEAVEEGITIVEVLEWAITAFFLL
jgi:hypothetical protein